MAYRTETPGQTQGPQLAWEHLGIPQEYLESVNEIEKSEMVFSTSCHPKPTRQSGRKTNGKLCFIM